MISAAIDDPELLAEAAHLEDLAAELRWEDPLSKVAATLTAKADDLRERAHA